MKKSTENPLKEVKNLLPTNCKECIQKDYCPAKNGRVFLEGFEEKDVRVLMCTAIQLKRKVIYEDSKLHKENLPVSHDSNQESVHGDNNKS